MVDGFLDFGLTTFLFCVEELYQCFCQISLLSVVGLGWNGHNSHDGGRGLQIQYLSAILVPEALQILERYFTLR